MNRTRWEILKELLAQALALPPQERPAFRDRVCTDHPDLCTWFEEMLAAANEDHEGFLDDLIQAFNPILDAALHTGPETAPLPRVGLDYEILEKLGEGGFGEVYKVYNKRTHVEEAHKFLHPYLLTNEKAVERFSNEAWAASKTEHVNIATVYDINTSSDGRRYIAMRYYPGETLEEKIDRGPLPVEEALDYTLQVARGLAAAHRAGVVHRDVKPGNLILTEQVDERPAGLVKIVDFGLAKIANLTVTPPGHTMGTPVYMSPEQIRGEEVDHRADIWALGVVLYEMLAGERPFKGEVRDAVFYSILNETPPPITACRPGLPPGIAHLIDLCLEKDPALRYPAMADLVVDLEQLTAPAPVPAAGRLLTAGLSVLVTLLILLAIPTVRQAIIDALGLGSAPTYLAVLPFTTQDTDPEVQAFCDGLVEQVSGQLVYLEKEFDGAFWVFPSTEIRIKGITDITEARKIGATLVVSGQCQRHGDDFTLQVQLSDAVQLHQIGWAPITAPMSQKLAFQDQILARLFDMMPTTLSPESRGAPRVGLTRSVAAYEHYVKGLSVLRRFDKLENVEEAITHFERALEAAPSYARAYDALCEALWRKYDSHSRESVLIVKAKDNCERALQHEPRLSSPYVTLALIHTDTGALDLAEQAIQKALTIDPSAADAYRIQGRMLERGKRMEEAEVAFLSSIRLRPYFWLNYNAIGNYYRRQGRYAEAASMFKSVIELTPDNYWGYNGLGGVYYDQADLQQARYYFEEALKRRKTYKVYSNLGVIHLTEKRYEEAAHIFEEARKLDDGDHRLWYNLGLVYRGIPSAQQKAEDAFRKAVELVEKELDLAPNDVMKNTYLSIYYAKLSLRKKAHERLERVLPAVSKYPVLMHFAADIYELTGDRTQALVWIERALEAGYDSYHFEQDTDLDQLRADPAYKQILQKHNKAMPAS